jgi:plastocyanin
MSRLLTRLLIALLSATLLGVAACSSDEGGKQLTLGSITVNDHGTKDVKGKSELSLEADSYYFSPTFIRGTAGQKLHLKIENESSAQHNFTLAGQPVDQDIPAKGKVEVDVSFPQSGVLRFFCKFHTDQGMNGELLAGDASPQPVTGGQPSTPAAPSGGGYYP